MIRTPYGTVEGVVEDGVHVWRGIPFAVCDPFGAPREPAAWDGVRPAATFGPVPPQGPPAPGVPSFWRPGDGDDYLTLNVWSPAPGASGLPVIVWIHGGRWQIGAGSMPHYDGAALAAMGVVVVTLNYRVGFLGFGHVPGAPGNRGLLDQMAALRWVRDGIAGFGGDPGNVTVCGHSAGAASAALLMRTGLFERAIAQSVPNGCRTLEEAARDLVAHPETLSMEELVALPGPYQPTIDGELVTGHPWETTAAGVDLVCGVTREEQRGLGVPIPPEVAPVAAYFGLPAEDYADAGAVLADALVVRPTKRVAAAHQGRTWWYEFAWQGPIGAAHGADVPFVFADTTSGYARRMIGDAPGFAELSLRLRTAWTSFAATGDPGWPRDHVQVWA